LRGFQLPDDHAGRDDLYIAACHIWHLGRKYGPVAAIEAWASRWAPWCGADVRFQGKTGVRRETGKE
jgi:hypothetical protein